MNIFSRFFFIMIIAILQFPFNAQAHDLLGANQQAKHSGSPAGPAKTKRIGEITNYHTLRDLARGSLQPNFDAVTHLQTRGFAGNFSNIVFGLGQGTARWPGNHQLQVCFFDGPQPAWNQVMAVFAEVLSYTTLSAVNLGKCSAAPAQIRISFAGR